MRERSSFFSLSHVQRMLGGNPVREGCVVRVEGRWGGLTRGDLARNVLRITREVGQEVVGEMEVAELRKLEHATGDVRQLVV